MAKLAKTKTRRTLSKAPKKNVKSAPKKAGKSSLRSAARARRVRKAVTGKIDSVNIRMYRAGTGDCFLLQFKSGAKVACNMMIDCGCIQGGRKDFEPWLEDIKKLTGGVVNILVVTHEHADHINGFQSVPDLFDEIVFERVWFSWTEDEADEFANNLRQNHSKLKLALQVASVQLQGLLQNKFYEQVFEDPNENRLTLESKKHFIQSLGQLDSLNVNKSLGASGKVPSMAQLFVDYNVIKPDTVVEFFQPGDLIQSIESLTGIRIFVLGPPRDTTLLNLTEVHGEGFEKREDPSSRDFAFAAAIMKDGHGAEMLPFESEFELSTDHSVKDHYEKSHSWRQIENDWLYTAGSMALRYERSINNTSLALAIQFEDSEKVLLFPGDAEFGNWKSWHDIEWSVKIKGESKKVKAEYLLNNTVFYKIGHHCSQNGSASRLGVDMMTHEELTAMAPLNFNKINTGWLNTMPNDLLCAQLIRKTNGRFLFSGDHKQILKNIKTPRVTIRKSDEKVLDELNGAFSDKGFIDWNVVA